ncbi:MAG: metal ABC transporter permease [Thermoanaerobaculia bacterium]|nr:metal ABC transporter permease [Thermoanaerobaculia bacterium]
MLELDFTTRNVLLGASLLGVVGGVMGCYAFLRRQSLLGDALAHAALPGVCLGFLLTSSKEPLPLFVGALAAGLAGALAILAIVRWSRLKEDTAIGMVLSVFFGVGIVLLTHIQKLPLGNQSGLDKFLFGQAATLMPRDLEVMSLLAAFVLGTVALFYKELKILCFDRDYGASLGFPMRWLEILLTLLLVTVVVVGLQTVGVILIVATLVMPAAAARQWTSRLGPMLFLAAVFGAASGAGGALLSARIAQLPTGPVIVLLASAVLVVSLLVAPGRGIVWSWLQHRSLVRRILRENLLRDLWKVGEASRDWSVRVPWAELQGMRGLSAREARRVGAWLYRDALVEPREEGLRLTSGGELAARALVRKHRLWELYLTRQLELAADHVHRDADAMEHTLSEEAVEILDEKLGRPRFDPHGQPIPRPETPLDELAGSTA